MNLEPRNISSVGEGNTFYYICKEQLYSIIPTLNDIIAAMILDPKQEINLIKHPLF
jgi:hypothetical protein